MNIPHHCITKREHTSPLHPSRAQTAEHN